MRKIFRMVFFLIVSCPAAAFAQAERCGTEPPIADEQISELVGTAVESALGWIGTNNLPQKARAFGVRARAQVLTIGSGVSVDKAAFARHYIYTACHILSSNKMNPEAVATVVTALEDALEVKL